MALSHEVGFYGIAELDGIALLATGGSVNLTQEAMFSSGVWGAGWKNAANQVAYAFNAVTLEGDISYELSAGDVFTKLKSFGFDNRNMAKTIRLLPNGRGGFNGNAYCSGVSFDCSEGAVVTGGVNFASDETDNFTATAAQDSQQGVGSAPPADSLFPYWRSKVLTGVGGSTSPTTEVGVTAWSASYTAAITFLTVCKTHTENPPVKPDYIMLGGMDAEGSYTVFGLTSDVSPSTLQTAKAVKIVMAPVAGTTGNLSFKYVIYNSGGISIVTGGDYVTAEISFTAVGDGSNPPLSVS